MNQTAAITPESLRRDAEGIAQGLPQLLAQADRLAASVALGAHGRKRPGLGDEFWQYRPATPGDPLRQIDWRRSARSDGHFVRQMEWQAVQSVHLWVDPGQSMTYASDAKLPTKLAAAQVLGLATASLLNRAGESFALMQDPRPPRSGRGQVTRMAHIMARGAGADDYAVPPVKEMARGSRALFISDFLGNWDAIVSALGQAADQSVRGALVQVLDPAELAFGFDGRTIFESMTGALRFETRRARAIRDDYLAKLDDRRVQLSDLARRTGWMFHTHATDASEQASLLWIHTALSEGRR